MILAEDGGPWQRVVGARDPDSARVRAHAGLQRFWSAAGTPEAAEWLLGTLGNVEVFLIRGDGRSVTIGSTRASLDASEGFVLRERRAT